MAGLVHPDTHFTGDKEGKLRVESYARLRIHGDFVNSGQRFFPRPVGDTAHFGVHIYGSPSEIGFEHLSWLVSVAALRDSSQHDGSGAIPGIRFQNKEYDERPHLSRVVHVDQQLLATWQQLLREQDLPPEQARLLFPVSTSEASAIKALALYPLRLSEINPRITDGCTESAAKRLGLIIYNSPGRFGGREFKPSSWRDCLIKGTQLSVATPIFKRHDANSNDPFGADLTMLGEDYVPDTAFVRVKERTREYLSRQDRWFSRDAYSRLSASPLAIKMARSELAAKHQLPEQGVSSQEIAELHRNWAHRRSSTFYRLAWRRQIAPNTERALYAALIPRGAAHVDTVYSLAADDDRTTALVAGFWASLPLDYFVRITGRSDLRSSGAHALPAPQKGHPLESALLVRTLRLNCLTSAYRRLWAELYDPSWRQESWACDWPDMQGLDEVALEWSADIPLRSERARRAALVEIDALVAVWLGMDVEALIAAYRGRFPVLQKYEAGTWFDSLGNKIAENARTIGQRQHKGAWSQFLEYQEDPGNAPVPDGYEAPFYKADREAEYRQAHAVFAERLRASGWDGPIPFDAGGMEW